MVMSVNYFKQEIIVGIDEVGRGCLAGPVVAAAVVLPEKHGIIGIKDSKKLSHKKKLQLDVLIRQKALAVGIGEIDSNKIDEVNILQASLLAMRDAVRCIKIKIDKVLVDGNHTIPYLDIEQEAITDGDNLIECISASSIIAKVYRDVEMTILDKLYPEYGWAQNKGYGTREHMSAILKYGITKYHRKSFSIKGISLRDMNTRKEVLL